MKKQEMMVLRWQSIGLIAALAVFVACEGTEQRMEEASRPAETTGTQDTVGAPPAAEMAEARAMPAAIEKAEELSDDIHSDIEDADWDDAAEKARSLQALSDSLKQTDAPTSSIAAYDSAVKSLETSIASRNQTAAGLAAGDVQRATLAMESAYSPEVPVAVGYMEVATRDMVYHGEAAAWDKAEESLKTLEEQYAKVKAHVSQRDQDLGRKIDGDIAALRGAVDRRDLDAVKEGADKVRDHIDDIAKTYEARGSRGAGAAAPSDTMRRDTASRQ